MEISLKIEAIKKLIDDSKYEVKYLDKNNVLEWIYNEPNFIKSLTKESENNFGTEVIGYKTNQWTTKLGEGILNDILLLLGKEPSKIKNHQRGSNGKKLDPDRETEEALYECKARNYTTPGTAGEKILGCPIKYCEVPRLYNKPLKIVCMAFQEVEASKDFQLFEPKSEELKMQINFWKECLKIEFIKASDLLDELLTI